MGLLFFPRGGSAHVAREPRARRCRPRAGTAAIVSGSLRCRAAPATRGPSTPASTSIPSTSPPRCERPTRCSPTPPLHPSYEDRPGAPDRVSPRSTTTLRAPGRTPGRARWRAAGAASADVLHLHHLTPLQRGRAARRARRPGRRAPARHRAADARGDRGGPAAVAARASAGWSGCATGPPAASG